MQLKEMETYLRFTLAFSAEKVPVTSGLQATITSVIIAFWIVIVVITPSVTNLLSCGSTASAFAFAFGTARIPTRPFLSATVPSIKKAIEKVVAIVTHSIIDRGPVASFWHRYF